MMRGKHNEMKKIKLEVGKTYRNREGKEVKIVEKDSGHKYAYLGNSGKWYTENGRCGSVTTTPFDLIGEVPTETRHTFKIPEGVKEITLDYFGNRIVVEMVPEERKEPKPGDVMINKDRSVYIFKGVVDDHNHEHYAWLGTSGRLAINTNTMCNPGRPATPEEAQPLWDALKKAGKRWNPEAMRVEDVPEIERIREWVWANLKSDLYDKSYIAEAIEAYLNQKEGKK